ncbi:GNAT family N-acetyltransferase [Micromonospora endolithica]|uniref:N-acetyltransferase n=1 Tax=Micromonospora endolithica TaxID=230091 RepID=A0A3A9YVQ1_9ACTN|nr:GNAT family N-acetyltransferase [Micromonospora endolithica]RKN40201.1 N-acetyltransferase [Micromonospora endolithica]TWJ22505.1 acetyltransferase (GNAT) family protein [Micromonospora endolithica]
MATPTDIPAAPRAGQAVAVPPDIRVRHPADLRRCAELLRAVHEADGYPLRWPEDPYRWLTPAHLRAAWVAADPDRAIVGHVLVVAGDQDAAEVSRLFVAPRARRRAVGRLLLDQTCGWAREHRRRLVLEVVDRPDGAAPALYAAAGWRLTGAAVADWTGPAGEPVVLYRYRAPA